MSASVKKFFFQAGILPVLHLLHADRADEARLPRRVITDRQNPFTVYSEEEFIKEYRLSKECFHILLDQIEPHLPRAKDGRGKVLLNSLLLPLLFSLKLDPTLKW